MYDQQIQKKPSSIKWTKALIIYYVLGLAAAVGAYIYQMIKFNPNTHDIPSFPFINNAAGKYCLITISFLATVLTVHGIIFLGVRYIHGMWFSVVAAVLLTFYNIIEGSVGTALVYCCAQLPINIITWVLWRKGSQNNAGKVNHIKWWILLIIFAFFVCLAIGWFFVERNTTFRHFWYGTAETTPPKWEECVCSALVFSTGIGAQVLMLLRVKEQWYMWLVFDIAIATLYIMQGNYAPSVIGIFGIAYTIYGIYLWTKASNGAQQK